MDKFRCGREALIVYASNGFVLFHFRSSFFSVQRSKDSRYLERHAHRPHRSVFPCIQHPVCLMVLTYTQWDGWIFLRKQNDTPNDRYHIVIIIILRIRHTTSTDAQDFCIWLNANNVLDLNISLETMLNARKERKWGKKWNMQKSYPEVDVPMQMIACVLSWAWQNLLSIWMIFCEQMIWFAYIHG